MTDERVLAALSSSPACVSVLGFARLFASMNGSNVVPLHVTEGDPVRAIVSAAHDPRVGLVVVGTRISPDGRRLGWSTRELAVRLTQPLLVVPEDATVPRMLERVLIPLERTDATTAPIHALFRTFPFDPCTEIVFMHTADDAPAPVTEAVPAAAAELDASMIVLSWTQVFAPGRAGLVNAVLGTSTHPTLLVPALYRRSPRTAARSAQDVDLTSASWSARVTSLGEMIPTTF